MVLYLAAIVGAQCPIMPPGFLCITQEAGNVVAQNARELAAQREKNAVLESALVEKDKTITELKETNRNNVEDLTGRLVTVTAEAAHEKGRRVQLEADKVFWAEIVKVAITNTRQKTNGIKVF